MLKILDGKHSYIIKLIAKMGNFECSCSREQYDTAKQYSKEKYERMSTKAKHGYNIVKDKTSEKIGEAKVKYAD